MKRVFALIVALVMVASMTTSAYAVEASTAAYKTETQQSATPRINWGGTAYLTTTGYCNITDSNNFFNDSPLVISDGNNPGDVTLRVLNESGLQVGGLKVVEPGQSVRLDSIPHDSGTYRIQGKATVEGSYYFDID